MPSFSPYRLIGKTTAEMAAITEAARAVMVDTDKNAIVVHDGFTPGGVPSVTESAMTTALAAKLTATSELPSGNDLNNATTAGAYYVNDSTSNAPITWCIVLVLRHETDAIIQIAHSFVYNRFFVRRYWIGDTSWSSWVELITPVFTKSYESSQQTITAGGALTLAHGLGVAPKTMQIVLVCASSNNNYAPGDVVFWDATNSEAGSDRGVSVWSDATNIYVRYGTAAATFSVLDKSTGGGTACTNSAWKLVIRAWA